MQDDVVGWGEEKVPPQQDAVSSALESESELESFERRWRHRWRHRVAIAVLVVGLTAGAVVPVMLCVRGWHAAQAARGLGAGRGVFTVVHCEGPLKDDSDNTIYTCTGRFARHGVSDVGASAVPHIFTVTDGSWHKAGATVLARMTGDGDVRLADTGRAAMEMALWITVALGVAFFEGAVVRVLMRWVLGRPNTWRWGLLLAVVFGVPIAGVLIFVVALLAMGAWFEFA